MDPLTVTLIGAIGAALGGVLLKVVEHFLLKRERGDQTAQQLRKELREDYERLRQELKDEMKESNEWQEKYWAIRASSLIANHKVDKVIDVVDEKHPDGNLKDDLGDLMDTDR